MTMGTNEILVIGLSRGPNPPPVILKIKMQTSLVFSITGFKTAEVIWPYTHTLPDLWFPLVS